MTGHRIVGRLVLLQNFVTNPGVPSGKLTIESIMKVCISFNVASNNVISFLPF